MILACTSDRWLKNKFKLNGGEGEGASIFNFLNNFDRSLNNFLISLKFGMKLGSCMPPRNICRKDCEFKNIGGKGGVKE